ncbi:MAG: hypothetical protein JWM76_4110 [Pseudonocardiales bacterium]|nr:hypothetical protein [Pseudonocardiales bacterium]
MLRRIIAVKNSGIFQNFRCDQDLPEFENVTIIYGPNGSGKTSLSNALYRATIDVESRANIDIAVGNFANSELVSNDQSVFDRLYVFSDSFVAENHRLSNHEATMPAIITLGKRSVDADDEIRKLALEIPKRSAALSRAQKGVDDSEREQLSLRKRVSGSVVDDLTKFGGDFQSRSRFSAATVEKLYKSTHESWLTLNSEKYQYDRKLVVSSPAEAIDFEPPALQIPDEIIENSKKVLAASPTAMVLNSLADNPMAEPWVSRGIELHEHATECIFCGNVLTEDRRRLLDAHFSQEVIRVSNEALEIARSLDELRDHAQDLLPRLPKRIEFDTDLRENFDKAEYDTKASVAHFSDWSNALSKRLRAKATNVIAHHDPNPISTPVNISTKLMSNLVKVHNDRASSHFALQTKASVRIRNHHLSLNAAAHDQLTKAIEQGTSRVKVTADDLESAEQRLLDLQNVEGSIAPSAEFLTSEVRRLLGRQELSFHAVGSDRYEVRRHDSPAHGLSEGERTAITLVHFLALVRSHDSDSKGKPIVVVDDPVSSLDQRIFIGVSSALWGLATAKNSVISQIILLTHNFELFRQWDIQWDRYPIKRTAKNPDGLAFRSYELRSRYIGTSRGVALASWPKNDAIRKKTRSAYHHAFITLADTQRALQLDDTFERRLEAQLLLPNVIRAVLETFLAFKIPENVGNLAFLMASSQKILDDNLYLGDGDALRHNLLRYSNVYSHSESPETDHAINPDEILAAIQSLFIFMDAVDRAHFVGMCQVTDISISDLLPHSEATIVS